ncbi:uncharacterized protein LY89DRAFT_779079 [Mollisia scopiformis]|uniref:Uncharacterized protein n=1 Tax=Mollisia scopiformis TaxID=149040 RepID=A0A194XJF5_MOLSC|nr:uncharacterized protein LY89DRAFT_779079 [Mollisia scopiformis]KUJ20288.1 hypothetical protein LY89DRAFT_779079 [Mollisia scopiformis]
MKLTISTLALLMTTALAAPGSLTARQEAATIFDRAVNDGRPVATGLCCIANTSKKGDTCTQSNGAAGICSVADTAGCGAKLTCT